MPIKFRCQYCRQFLGISRTKAGDVVDCPTCGRSVRVPNLDGTVAPVPEPKLDVHELAGALNELARIGDESGAIPGDGHAEEEFAPAHKPLVVKELAPLPRPEPISLEPPPAAVPVNIHERPSRPSVADRAPAESLAMIVPEPGEAAVSFPAVLKSWPAIGVILASAVVTFSLGWIVGGMGRSDSPEPSESNQTGNGKTAGGKQPPAPVRLPVYHPDSWKTAVEGQISYRTSDGNNPADAGARVIFLPAKGRPGGQSKVPVAGFWAGASDEDFRVALAALRELGGNAALADRNGNFTVKLPPSSGKYHVVAISTYKENDFETAVPASTRAVLADYFDRPDSLIRKLAFTHDTVNYTGGKVERWNHSFK